MSAATFRSTAELRTGDVVRHPAGMRLRIGEVTTHAPGGPYGPVYRSAAEVLNLAELEAAAAADPAGNAAFCLRFVREDGGTWTVQGNRLARWAVEAPAVALDHCPSCGRRITDTDAAGMEAEDGQRWCIAHHQAAAVDADPRGTR